MTTTDRDIPHLLRLCEATPVDPLVFGVLADKYAEAGDEKMAFAWGWMFRKRKWPYPACRPHEIDPDQPKETWPVSAYGWSEAWQPPGDNGDLPPAVVYSRGNLKSERSGIYFDTFLAAVAWLADRLDEVRAAL